MALHWKELFVFAFFVSNVFPSINSKSLNSEQNDSQKRLAGSVNGLSQCGQPNRPCRKIGIVGAGAAGLYCGILLAEVGHTVKIFEAKDRAGGRIQTYRDSRNPSKYMAELGPMRFPLDSHPLLNDLIRNRYHLNISEFINFDENAYIFVNGILATNKQARENPDMFKFNTSQSERGKTPGQLMAEAIKPASQLYSEQGWEGVRKRWDPSSLESYYYEMGLSRGAIDYIAVLGNGEAHLHLSVLEILRRQVKSTASSKYYRITDGNDLLANKMVENCQNIQLNRCSITYSTPIKKIQLLASNQSQLTTMNGTTEIFDTIVVATPPTVTKFFDFEPQIDFNEKYLALRQVSYICNTKIFLFFNESWWYTQENIQGGASTTDLPIRSIYYPSTSGNHTDGGTVLAAFAFFQDSVVWQSLSELDAIELTLQQLIRIHPNSSNMRNFFQGGKVKHWCLDPYARGAFTFFFPYQETKLFDQLKAPISNIHFIGESTSLTHGWIEGALESAVRGAKAINLDSEPDIVKPTSGFQTLSIHFSSFFLLFILFFFNNSTLL